MRQLRPSFVAIALAAAVGGVAAAQSTRLAELFDVAGSGQARPPGAAKSGASGHPLMNAEAIREAAANFHGCLERLWPLAARARRLARNLRDARLRR